ncbi:hypothetical protein FQR65_LT06415 [Abscondita terminalis]|nr:hypothetical protein FQR65_LT06415 [Abscondita terminalis]
MHALLLLGFLIQFSASKVYKLHDYEAFYWRDFEGVIPSDAFLVAKSNNRLSYITQVVHKELLIPGTLDYDLKNALYEYDGKSWSTNKNIKIFCTQLPHLFEWSPTQTSSFMTDKNYVVGGYEPNRKIFIGKTLKEDKLLVGKVVFSQSIKVYLHSVLEERAVTGNSFEVLTFTPILVNDANSLNFASTPALPRNVMHPNDVYYWRDFKDEIPFDALSVGLNSEGVPIYLAQVFHKGLLMPGSLKKGSKRAIYEYETKQWDTSENIKILCTNYPQFLHWQATDTCQFSGNAKNIIGGYDSGLPVFIGRSNKENQILVGKIFGSELPVLHTTFNKQSIRLKFFDVLVYRNEDVSTTTFLDMSNYRKTSTIADVGTTTKGTLFQKYSTGNKFVTTTAPQMFNTMVEPHETYFYDKDRKLSTKINYHSTKSKFYGLLSTVKPPSSDVENHHTDQIIGKNGNKIILVSDQRIIDSHLYNQLKVGLLSASKNQNNHNCDCGERVYIININ